MQSSRRFWRYLGGLGVPIILWALFVGVLADALRARMHGGEQYDADALREWAQESRVVSDTLPELVRDYLDAADPDRGQPADLPVHAQAVGEQLQALGQATKMYQSQLPLFPAIYRMEVQFPHNPALGPIVWDSGVPRPTRAGQVRRLEDALLGASDGRALLRIEYQTHAYNKRQHDEQLANVRLRWVGGLAVAATGLAFVWITLFQRHERDRERQRALARRQIDQAEKSALANELRRREAERRHEEAEHDLLKQRLATQAAEQQALELKSQLYASIGIMAGSYAHNIKNLLVRPNDLLRRCLEADGLSPNQEYMLHEVRQTLGTVTERLQQILQTVRRDPTRSVLARLDLNAVVGDLQRTWEDLAREKWKLLLTAELSPEPLWIDGDVSHLQQAVENLLFNARDATFEMRNHLREQAHRTGQPRPDGADGADVRQALITAAAWRGTAVLRTRRAGDWAVLEVQDNGIGMTEEVRRRCTETHFTTKRDNAIYEGISTGMGLGLSFVTVILEHHRATLEIESAPQQGALFRIRFPAAKGAD
jgi:signal transduction histidine kinase